MKRNFGPLLGWLSIAAGFLAGIGIGRLLARWIAS